MIPEGIWRRAERDMVRRERVKRIRNGTIIPAFRGLPSMTWSVGKWWPNSNSASSETETLVGGSGA